jgi:hypothetical protein
MRADRVCSLNVDFLIGFRSPFSSGCSVSGAESMHQRMFEGLLSSTWSDVLFLEVRAETSALFSADVGMRDTGCAHWIAFAEEHGPASDDLAAEYDLRVIRHPKTPAAPVQAETESYTQTENSATMLAYYVARGVVARCHAELAAHRNGKLTDQQLADAITGALPEFDPNDAEEVFARLQREFVILAETEDRESTVELVEHSEIILPPNEHVAEIHKALMAQPENKRNKRATCKEIAAKYPHLKLKPESLRAQYNTWRKKARQ